ncbi:interferon-related developmental regulator-domain-containing protein [Bombardia bombarda]|uniref:Interferon-related developmental regulator-domain-containing protein n=1 Tax=Bombardia bombarda TaxID=252184 RepID=A0AA39XLM4_9PEZI|nr:interferon-related developmental regulator-domain-containing protein [Bombardia bombarda]
MHDLRKKALLESGKTMSRKSQAKTSRSGISSAATESPASSRPGSRTNSRAPSRANSQPNSRYASEDDDDDADEYGNEDGLGYYDSENTQTSTESGSDIENDPDWVDRIESRIDELQDRKRQLSQREEDLYQYCRLIRHHYASVALKSDIHNISSALLRGIRSGGSTTERSLALEALTLTMLNCPSGTIFSQVSSALKFASKDGEEDMIKTSAIRALSIAMLYEGSKDDAESVLEFLLDIIESDGHVVDAPDNGKVVTAALRAWAFVATQMDDLESLSDRAMEAFMDQLDSTDPSVQMSAGTNIALLFEAARDSEEETGESSSLQHEQYRIMTRMGEIVRSHSKRVSRKDRRQLRSKFNSIITSLELGKGPGYSTASTQLSNPHTGGGSETRGGAAEELGYRTKIRIHNMYLIIDSWSLLARVETIKPILGNGFHIHFLENPVIRDLLGTAQVEYLASSSWKNKPKQNQEPKRGKKPNERFIF